MKTALKITGYILLGIVFVITAGLSYVKFGLPNVEPAPDMKVEMTKADIERGRYLAHNVFVCVDCHSDKDYSKFGLTVKEGTIGKGGNLYGIEMGLPGDFYARNLTPYNLGDWTDGEIFRAITVGVNKDGEALFPLMPYGNYRKADPEDIMDIIAYLRTLEPIEYDVPDSEPAFPMNFIINTIPAEPEFTKRPDISDRVKYGKYLVTVASCSDCHTPSVQGEPLPGMDFAGGMQFKMPGGTLTVANITPDLNTGIGSWSEEAFIGRFKQYQDSSLNVNHRLLGEGEFQTEMPWRFYSNMSEEELGAIYAYLRTLNPIENKVTKWVASSE